MKVKDRTNVKEFNNLKEILQNSQKQYKDNIAFCIKHKDEQTKQVEYENKTYEQFVDEVNSLGQSYYDLGFAGKRIAIIGKNQYGYALAHFANLLGSIVSIPLDKDLQYDELLGSVIRSRADVLVFDKSLVEKIEMLKNSTAHQIEEYICMTELEGYENIDALVQKGKKSRNSGNCSFEENEIDNDKMAILLFTSGTTSKSKAVMISQKNVASNIYAMQLVEDIRSDDVNIAFLPFHHIFGSTGLAMMLACGVKTVFPDGLRYIAQNLKEYEVTIFIGVPALIEAIYKTVIKEIKKQGKEKTINFAKGLSNTLRKVKIDIRRTIFKQVLDALGGKLRLLISGGASADPEISQAFIDMGIDIVQGYGLSETSPVIAAESLGHVKNGSVGLAMENDIIEIVDKDENGIGQIRVKRPNVMLGYYEMEELTNGVLKDGWFYTGDLGYIDNDGYLFITGRSKNLIVLRNGKKVFPEELELLVNRFDEVEESMVFGMPDSDGNPKVALEVVLNKEEIKQKYNGKNEQEIYEIIWNKVKELNKTFPRYKHIQKLIISDEELIKTTTKKVKRHEEIKKAIKRANKE